MRRTELVAKAERALDLAEQELRPAGLSVFLCNKLHALPYAARAVAHFTQAGDFFAEAEENSAAFRAYQQALANVRVRNNLRYREIREQEGLVAAWRAKYRSAGMDAFVEGPTIFELIQRMKRVR